MTELMAAGTEIMLVGMVIVYAFLALLIGAVHLMADMVARFFPEPQATDSPVQTMIDPGTIAAISAAVHHHRQKGTNL